MAEADASMLQECESQGGLAPDACATRSHRLSERADVRGTEIGQFASLEIAPEQFDGIELRGVGGQAFDAQPGPLPGEVARHAAALVRAQAIPDEHHPLAAKVPLQGPQEEDEVGIRIRAWVGLKVQARAAAIPPKRQGGRDRQSLPIRPGVVQDGRLAARRPGPPHDGLLRDPAFVLEDYPGVAAPRVFFTCGQRWRRQWRRAPSSRSRAWRVGRCSDQCKPCRSRQTCAG